MHLACALVDLLYFLTSRDGIAYQDLGFAKLPSAVGPEPLTDDDDDEDGDGEGKGTWIESCRCKRSKTTLAGSTKTNRQEKEGKEGKQGKDGRKERREGKEGRRREGRKEERRGNYGDGGREWEFREGNVGRGGKGGREWIVTPFQAVQIETGLVQAMGTLTPQFAITWCACHGSVFSSGYLMPLKLL